MRSVLARIGGVLLAAMACVGSAAGQEDAAKIADALEGAWLGEIKGAERAYRYLEVLSVLPGGPGGISASVLFGWADGTVGLAPASVTQEGRTVVLALTAGNGTKVRVRFDGSEIAQGRYQAQGKPERPIRFTQLAEHPNFEWLNGLWSASRNNQTRIFDIKRVVGTADGAVIAIGQYGIVEEPDNIRQMAATVAGDENDARIVWRTRSTAAELKRVTPFELKGSFETAGHVDPIAFRLPPPSAGAEIEIGQPFPDFALTTLAGETQRLSDFRGKSVVLIFFQSWDVWGRHQVTALRYVKKRFGERLVILPVNFGTVRPDESQRSASARKQDAETYTTESAPVAITKLPSVWLIDAKGIVLEKRDRGQPLKLASLVKKATRKESP